MRTGKRATFTAVAVIALAVGWGNSAFGGDAAEGPKASNGDVLEFSAGQAVDVRSLIPLMSGFLEKPFFYNQGQLVNKKVDLSRSITVEPDKAIDVFNTILRMTGLAVVEYDSYAEVVPAANAKVHSIPLWSMEELAKKEDSSVQVSVVIPLQNTEPTGMQGIMSGLIDSQNTTVRAVPESGVLFATGPANTLARLVKVAREVDLERTSSKVEIYVLKNASAVTLAEHLDPMLKSVMRASKTNRSQIKVDYYERLNALLVLATPVEHENLTKLIAELDGEAEAPPSSLHVYDVKNRTAVDIAEVLEAFFTSGGSAGGTTTRLLPGAAKGPQVPFRIVADEKSNSLVIVASESDYKELEGILAKLDTRRAQVLIEAALVDVSGSDLMSVGVELAWLDDVNLTQSLYRSAFGLASSAADSNTSGISNIPFSAITKGITTGYIKKADDKNGDGIPDGPNQFTALMKAFAGNSKINIVAQPILLTTDAEEAEFISVDQRPTAERTTDGDDEITSFGEYVDAGVKLTVKPYIRAGNHVRIEVYHEISDFSETTAGGDNLPPPKVTRQVTATVDVPDQRIVVIGGLTRNRTTKQLDRIPLLSSIPIVGELFKNRDNNENRNTVYLFLSPHILRDQNFADLADETERRVEKLENANQGPLSVFDQYQTGPVEEYSEE